MLKILLFIQEAMQNFVHDMLHNSPAAQRIEALWKVIYLLSASRIHIFDEPP